jgi:tRNA-splicing ligase RtcB
MKNEPGYELIRTDEGVPIKAWVKGVPMEDAARQQLVNAAHLPFIHKWIAAMPDVHYGIGATVGSVIPTKGAIIPAAVGVDIGCGMMAVQTSLTAKGLPDSLKKLRTAIEKAVPHGRTNQGKAGDRGAWNRLPDRVQDVWRDLQESYNHILAKHPGASASNNANHLGTLGTGNHFIEVCLDEKEMVWIMLHSGSRGVGNRIGSYFIELAKEDMRRLQKNLPDKDLAYFSEGTRYFDDYVEAVGWAQEFARENRQIMMDNILSAVRHSGEVPPFTAHLQAINCHHNYVAKERHYGEDVYLTRKGAVRAGRGELGIIPGSMGTRSYLVRGLGNPESFESCSHGAGRAMSRSEARRRFTVQDHTRMTEGIECRKDADVIDETPAAYKPIDAVMAAQKDLVEVVHELRQVVVVKG